MGRVLLVVLLVILPVPVAVLAWLRFGHVPVAVEDPPFPEERTITGIALDARIGRELVKIPPIQADEASLVAGAHIYSENCAVCHGFHGKPSAFGAHMFPDAPPLWEMHHHGTETKMGVTDDPPGETYWKVANGIRLTGMPSFKDELTETEMWQVSLLLANADKPLPPAALEVLSGEPPAPAPAAVVPESKKK